jgi:hypothetical protein
MLGSNHDSVKGQSAAAGSCWVEPTGTDLAAVTH